MVVRATVIKIARAIIILKPAFLAAPPPPGRWTTGGGGVLAVGERGGTGARWDVGRGQGRGGGRG